MKQKSNIVYPQINCLDLIGPIKNSIAFFPNSLFFYLEKKVKCFFLIRIKHFFDTDCTKMLKLLLKIKKMSVIFNNFYPSYKLAKNKICMHFYDICMNSF